MFAASSSRVNSNPKTQEAIRRQLRKQGIDVPEPKIMTVEDRLRLKYQKEREETERKWKEFADQIDRLDQAEQRDQGPHTLSYVARWVCRAYGVTLEQLKSPSRRRDIVLARKAFCYWSKKLVKNAMGQPVSTVRLGHFLRRDHSTIVFALKTYRADRIKWRGWKRSSKTHSRDSYGRP